ncbi:MAG: hypothetical protein IKN65_06225 [Clostridia bacterium]|nr:hypothetical protein [Clostridia bacterium]
MTKKEMFATIATINADNAEIVEFCNHQIELLDNRKTSKTPTKKQKENEVIMDTILSALVEMDSPVTVTELIANGEGLEGLANQKVSALLRKLVLDGKVVKTTEGKKSVFSIA